MLPAKVRFCLEETREGHIIILLIIFMLRREWKVAERIEGSEFKGAVRKGLVLSRLVMTAWLPTFMIAFVLELQMMPLSLILRTAVGRDIERYEAWFGAQGFL